MNENTRELIAAARAGVEGHSPDEAEALAFRLADVIEEMEEANYAQTGSAEVEAAIELIESLPAAVAEKRKAEGLSLRAASMQCDVLPGIIARVEKGAGVSSDTLKALLRWAHPSEGVSA